ncbi:Flp family type IVb pilin [Paraburkholderia lycopersici]|uniref:Flp family type IVb pilin n=1 Tax=Paraburkholderia lycopersici TaxID=416944 RepID=UPI000B0A6DBE|nr:Flp family type IVb pilin [Paraburkholderia lycopersici]
MNALIKKFIKSEEGVTALEYGLIAGLIAIAIVSGATMLGDTLNSTFQQIGNTISASVKPAGT